MEPLELSVQYQERSLRNIAAIVQQNFAQIGQDLAMANLSAEQQAYSSLRALSPLSAHGTGAQSPVQSSDISFSA